MTINRLQGQAPRDGPVSRHSNEYSSGRGLVGRFLPFTIGERDTFPADAQEDIKIVVQRAERFARDNTYRHPDDATAQGKKLLQNLIPPTEVDAFSQVLRGIFWSVCSATGELIENRPEDAAQTPSAFGGKSQTSLTRAFLIMSAAERAKTRFLLSGYSEQIQQTWKSACIGAFAVARLARRLLEHGVPTVLPTRKIDAIARVDLIAVIDHPVPVHLCFQVKRSGVHVESSLVFLEDQAIHKQPWDIQMIRLAMQRFAKFHNFRCVPMIFRVGDDGSTPWDIQGGAMLDEIVTDLLVYAERMDD